MLFFILSYFLPFHPINSQENENIKKLKMHPFYTNVPKIMIIGYTVPEIWCMMDVIIIFVGYFLHFYPPNSWANEYIKKNKKHLEISSFYTSASKFMIICYTVPEIWCMTDVIIIFHFVLFFALLAP